MLLKHLLMIVLLILLYDGCSTLSIKGSHTLHQGNYITIQYGNDDKYMKGKKFKIKSSMER